MLTTGTATTPDPLPLGTLVYLSGTQHKWAADDAGTLHWLGDWGALQAHSLVRGKREHANLRLPDLLAQPRGEPWLSAPLLRAGDALYVLDPDPVRWGVRAPLLFQVVAPADRALFGIPADGGSGNGAVAILEQPAWEGTTGLEVGQ